MTGEATIVLHAGDGRLTVSTYLYRVGLHLLAFSAIALAARLLVRTIAAGTPVPVAEPEPEETER